ncbi:phospho-N-acetylmuramoyl-pentapeptide-transferase [Gloeothece citriformis PCC 7424]|uniref:Phospho-N-acetylmuramoyl-pentapeptide-transferase n=1 Tax=Gloeothece citriformis (strain PCC 7424) TaxID=65393 RepID=MRAY_GLOC7|nr:phospho-N-acetylmuramoyl-pentapeptide-transferase [Gloeothece citriformis]B7KDB2.1 RecName: Full=Phospho-N-acetylmuramoyl-pentapeptide-transferase; AltName: Full=UDP-MurNAc-pentapeptide phosphotransferase [Gloeothece citriformis PCC 7424]ACK68932.1 phospho-N-acetylmuramoyl-pentapeptide-transferase [Gloeothece citriformis PCC 7424]
METKLFSSASLIKPSGTSLLILLTVVLFLLMTLFQWLLTSSLEGIYAVILPVSVSAIACGLLGFGVIPLLRWLKTGQFVREDGPQSHLKKAGTPTMGGIFFIPVAVGVALIGSKFDPQVVAVGIVTLAYMMIGWVDDWQVLRQKSNKGISPKMKLLLQIAVAVLFCLWMLWTGSPNITNLSLPGNLIIPLGWLFWILAIFVLVAESNATNITDGVDGLASGTCAIAFLGLAAIVAPTSVGLMIFCACLSGGCLGFVLHNRNPAKVFMGDTGSLALGGALAAVGLLSGNLWGLFIISGIFFVESLSVIAQVSYYKATKGPDGQGKRLLKMAPLHHHLELSGWSETQIVGVFYLINAGLAILGFISR